MRYTKRGWMYIEMALLLALVAVLVGMARQQPIAARPDPVAAQSGDKDGGETWERQSAEVLAKVSPDVQMAMAEGPVDFLVVLAAQADLSLAKTLPTKEAKGRFVYNTLQTLAQRTQAPLRAVLDAQGVSYRSFYIVNALQVTGDQDMVLMLAQRPEVARIVANPRVQMSLPQPVISSDRSPVDIEWNISKVGAPEVWAMGYTGQNIVVAGQDTGYDWDHPALKSQYRGWNGTALGSTSDVDHDYHWHDAVHSGGGSCGPDAPAPCDDHGHGTHTLGTMVGDDGGDRQIGMAPGARWIGCRNMDRGNGTPAMYIECFEFFLAPYAVDGTSAHGRPDMAPDVIGNSWSCPPSEGCDWDTLQTVVEVVRAAGIMVVAAAGNSGPSCSTVRDPIGLYDAAYTIGATNRRDEIALFSGRGPVTIDGSGRLKPDIVAPGVNVLSSQRGGWYGLNSGTSMATPHVVGAAALLWSARPALRGHISQTEQLLNAAPLPLYSTQCGNEADQRPNNVYGWGRLDALAAVQRAVGGWLEGRVMSAAAPVEGAVVRAQLAQALSWETSTRQSGAYTLSLVTGAYTVTASAAGYIPYLTTGVTVAQGHTTTLDIVLAPCDPMQDASITFTPTIPHPHDSITFTASVTAGTPPIAYAWTLAPGIYAQGSTVTATYGTRGVYPVTLTLANCGGSVTVTRRVTVTAPEIAVTAHELAVGLREGETASRAVTVTNVGDYPLSWGFVVTPTVDWLHLNVITPSRSASFRTRGQGTRPVRNLDPSTTLRMTPLRLDPSAPSLSGLRMTGDLMGGTTIIMPLAPQRSATLSATFDAGGLAPGGYTSTLVITSTDTTRPYIALPVTLGVDCELIGGLGIDYVPEGDIWAGERVTFTAEVLSGTLPITYTWMFGDGRHASGKRVVHTYPITVRTHIYSLTLATTNPCQVPQRLVYPIIIKARVLYLPCVLRAR